MKKNIIYSILWCMISCTSLQAKDAGDQTTIATQSIDIENDINQTKQQKNKPSEKKVSFTYQDADLVDVINHVSSLKNVNMVLPMGANDKINAKLTFNLEQKVTISQAWDLLGTFLSIAGYSIVPHGDYYGVVKNSKD